MKMFMIYTIISLFMPLGMVAMGKVLKKHMPKEINYAYGFRTKLSMKNNETWKFANENFAKLIQRMGYILVLSALPMVFAYGKERAFMDNILSGIVFVQIFGMFLSIALVEIGLNKKFDKNGDLKK